MFVLVTAIIISFCAIIFTNSRDNMYDLDLSEAVKYMETLTFKAKIPTKAPFQNMKTVQTKIEDNKMTIELINSDKNCLDIIIAKHNKPFSNDVKKENIIIHNNLEGIFIPDASGKRILLWKDRGIYYQITYYPKISPKEVSKNQLINMAESFK